MFITFQVSYCDSSNFATAHINMSKNVEFLNFISAIIKDGVSKSTYTKRADIIMTCMNPEVRALAYGNSLITCEATISHVINALLSSIPSAIEVTQCISWGNEKFERSVMYLTYQVGKEARLDKLQAFLDEQRETDFINCAQIGCGSLKTIKKNISKMNLFFDVHCREGKLIKLINIGILLKIIISNIIIFLGENNQCSSEAASITQVRLCDIYPILISETETFELRGVISFRQGKSKLRKSIGHYTTYAKRHAKDWELYDDLKTKPIPVKDTTMVPCEFLLYTI